MDSLFIRMSAMYGHMWRSIYKSEAFTAFSKHQWMQGLKDFDNATLGKALIHCRQNESYPPSLPLFIEICRSTLKRQVYQPLQFDSSKADPAVARMHLDKIRAILNMPSRSRETLC